MLEVVEAGGLITVQDAGRVGWRRFGVPLAGPMDRFAFDAANLLVGNQSGMPALESGAGDLVFRAQYDCVIAVTGAGYDLSINDWNFALWGSYFVRGGSQVRLTHTGFGMWSYVATAGGFDCQRVLGSASTYLRGRLGGLDGRQIQSGDVLSAAPASRSLMESAARTIDPAALPAYGPSPLVDVIRGPQADRFTDEELATFFGTPYQVTTASDRMGYRLEGIPLHARGSSEMTSEGMAIGCIQVPADGQPIAMLADSATAGGYPKIACVTSAAMPLLAQCTPGRDLVRFRQVTVEDAQTRYRLMMDMLGKGIIDED